ncbi:MAG: hypothetical protein WD696_21870 [Bryobacteraceae bacterium]
MRKVVILIGAVLLVGSTGSAVWRLWAIDPPVLPHSDTLTSDQLDSRIGVSPQVPVIVEPSNWRSFSDEHLGISFQYPSEWGSVGKWVMSTSSKVGDQLVIGELVILSFDGLDHVASDGLAIPRSLNVGIALATKNLQFEWGEGGPVTFFTGEASALLCPLYARGSCQTGVNPEFSSLSYYTTEGAQGDLYVRFVKRVQIESLLPRFAGVSVVYFFGPSYPTTSEEYRNPQVSQFH